MKILSLFSNIGVAEANLNKIGCEVLLANELDSRRADLYKSIYPETQMICGDITDKTIFSKIVKLSVSYKIDAIIATPPCQGMSTAGQQKPNDARNNLIVHTISAIKEIGPKYALIENVPQFLKTTIINKKRKILIPDLIKKELGKSYYINYEIFDSKNYSVAQTRERAIILLTRKNQKLIWSPPPRDRKVVSLKDVIGKLPPVDPVIKDIRQDEMTKVFPEFEKRRKAAIKFSRWHKPPSHVLRQIKVMQYTPTGKSAFSNLHQEHRPHKKSGAPVRGFANTYKRQNWDTPGYAITMDNVKISSQNNVHPGRLIREDDRGNKIYSDPRTLTLYEIMCVMSIPEDWPLPADAPEAFLRRVIGEGVPPLMVQKFFEQII